MKIDKKHRPVYITTQRPLDFKVWVSTTAELADLGPNNEKAKSYYKGMFAYVMETDYVYRWVVWDPNGSDSGLIPGGYTYPECHLDEMYDYSGKTFNFVQVDLGSVNDFIHLTDTPSQYPTSPLANGNPYLVAVDPTDLTGLIFQDPCDHNHDCRYYTETELDSGQLDNRYYTEQELDNGQLDNRYYTETEIDANFYTKTDLDNGQLDNRYYTETEINTFLSQKADINHEHSNYLAKIDLVEQTNTSYGLQFKDYNNNPISIFFNGLYSDKLYLGTTDDQNYGSQFGGSVPELLTPARKQKLDNINIGSGEYTPTITDAYGNVSNITINGPVFYTKNDSYVTLSGYISITTTDTSTVSLLMSLPISYTSNFPDNNYAKGAISLNTGEGAYSLSEASGNRILLNINNTSASTKEITFTITYKIV